MNELSLKRNLREKSDTSSSRSDAKICISSSTYKRTLINICPYDLKKCMQKQLTQSPLWGIWFDLITNDRLNKSPTQTSQREKFLQWSETPTNTLRKFAQRETALTVTGWGMMATWHDNSNIATMSGHSRQKICLCQLDSEQKLL